MSTIEYRLELVVLPVADVDRAKAFYETCGFRLDVDHDTGPDFRVVQFTPPGSACSIGFGVGLTTSTAAVVGLHLVVTDIEAAHRDLVSRGVDVDPIRHMTPDGWRDGVDPAHTRYNSFAHFTDPDGNGWMLQEVPAEE